MSILLCKNYLYYKSNILQTYKKSTEFANLPIFCGFYLGCVDTIRNAQIASRFFVFQGKLTQKYGKYACKMSVER